MERFSEDALRMLRAVRFAAQLGFEIHEDTKAAVRALAPTIAKISAERIQVELVKLITSPHPEEMRTVYELGLSNVILPEFDVMMEMPQINKHHMYTVGEHTIQTLINSPSEKIIRITMLFHDVAKPDCRSVDEDGQEHYYEHPQVGADKTKEILKRLKFDNDTINRTYKLIQAHDDRPAMTEKSVRRALNRIGLEQFPALFEVKRADIMGQSEYLKTEKLAYVDEFEQIYRDILEKQQCVTKKDMLITGKDLIAMGMTPGKQMGEILDTLFEMILENPEMNDRDRLLQEAKRFL